MRTFRNIIVAAIGAALLASCSTTPKIVQAPPPPAAPNAPELPYQWTQGNAPQAHKDAVALFGPLYMKPGQYRWIADVPTTGDTKIVIDRLSQLFYVYRDDKLI